MRRCAFRSYPQKERRADVEVPDFHRVHAMPVRPLARLQQEMDCRGAFAPVGPGRVAKSLAEMTAFGMRFKPEQADDGVG